MASISGEGVVDAKVILVFGIVESKAGQGAKAYVYKQYADVQSGTLTGSFSHGHFDWAARLIFGELDKRLDGQ